MLSNEQGKYGVLLLADVDAGGGHTIDVFYDDKKLMITEVKHYPDGNDAVYQYSLSDLNDHHPDRLSQMILRELHEVIDEMDDPMYPEWQNGPDIPPEMTPEYWDRTENSKPAPHGMGNYDEFGGL